MKSRALIFAGLVLLTVPVLAGADELPVLRRNGAEAYFADLDLRAAFVKAKAGTLPESRRRAPVATARTFDWTTVVKRPYSYTQKDTPYCWAFAAVAAFEWNWALRNGGTPPVLAVQPIIDYTKRTGGAPSAEALRALMERGTCLFSLYPYTGKPGTIPPKIDLTYRAIAWGRVSTTDHLPTPEEIKKALVERGPLVASVKADTKAFEKYRGGIFKEHAPVAPGEQFTDHAVVIVGWDDRKGKGCWKIENSWGPEWGEGGYMWIEYGCNAIGRFACWVRPQSTQYHLPADLHKQVGPDVRPFHRWARAKALTATPPELKPVSAAEATTLIGQRVLVDFSLQTAASTAPSGHVALLSGKAFDEKGCLVLLVMKPALARFPAQDARGLLRHYRGKKLQVRGSVEPLALLNNLSVSVIEITDPEQIKVIE